MSNKIKLTIGVNIYNVQKYLRECLDSVVSQKGDDIEIILVDDGSTDNSGKICDEYAERDSRIRVTHQANVGLGLARNVIIENAKGKWLTFVDGDDKLIADTIEKTRPFWESEHDVIVFLEKNNCIDTDLSSLKQECITDILYCQTNIHNAFPPYDLIKTWGKLFSTDLFKKNNLAFRDIRKSQDFIFSIEYLNHVKSILLVPVVIYEYNINDDSISLRYNPNVLNTIDLFMRTLFSVINANNIKNERLYETYYREGLIEIHFILNLTLYNADCNWNKHKRISFLKKLLDIAWIKECINHEEYMIEHYQTSVFCKYGRLNDVESIDNYFIKIRNKRKYFKINKCLRKISIMSSIMSIAKKVLNRK